MNTDADSGWKEELPRRIPIVPPVLSLIFGYACLVIYLAFMLFKEEFPFDIIIDSILFCALLVYLLIFNRYIYCQINTILHELRFIPGSEEQQKNLNKEINQNLLDYKELYVIVSLMIISFLIIDLFKIKFFNPIFDQQIRMFESMSLSIVFDIFNYLLFFFMLYLISGIVWMILKISSILSIIAGESYKHFIDINLVSVDKVGGLGIIRDIISKIILYYSLAISLIILAYIKPQLYTVVFEIAAFAILLLIGVILLLWGLQSLQRLFRERVVEGFNKINEEYQNQYKNLTEAISGEMDDEALASITKKIEALNKEIAEKEKILIENRDIVPY